jgi:hypothetical protein
MEGVNAALAGVGKPPGLSGRKVELLHVIRNAPSRKWEDHVLI